MILRLPITGTELRFKHKHIRALSDELAAADRTMQDLMTDPWLTATRLIQVGRAYEEEITLEQADDLIDREKEGGVLFEDLFGALLRAFRGQRNLEIPLAADQIADAPAQEKKDEAEPGPRRLVS